MKVIGIPTQRNYTDFGKKRKRVFGIGYLIINLLAAQI
jgi:hypothetical protein